MPTTTTKRETIDTATPPEPVSDRLFSHRLEHEVSRELRECEAMEFDSLTVRPMPGGVCVQGFAHGKYDRDQVASIIRRVAKVDRVIDQVVTQA